jgi:hypothetical protein
MNVTETLTMYQSINSQNITANEELIVNLFEAIDSSDFKLLVKYFDKNIIYQRPGYHDLIGIDKLLHFYQYDRIIVSGKYLGKINYILASKIVQHFFNVSEEALSVFIGAKFNPFIF